MWPEALDGAQNYELKIALIGGSYAMDMLHADTIFQNFVIDAPISPTHLTTTGCALSSEHDATNCRMAVCPRITDWLTCNRKGQWVCADLGDGTCGYQHRCKGGLDCDEELCQLAHPKEESRWVVFSNKAQHWTLAMTIAEAIHYAGTGNIAALATADADCAYADVWRASIKAVAYDRKEIATATAAAAPAEQTATPAPATAAPTTPAATLATMNATPAAAAAAIMQHALPDAAIQVAPPDAQLKLTAAAKKRAE